ncbi:MAG: peroxiredoxin-like family protein [Acidimicrobiia bacterium]|jgi:peroxiredoxin
MADHPTLHDQIDADVIGHIPEPVAEMIDRMVADLRERDATPGIAVGEIAPLFEAPDALGNLVRLDDVLADGPVVLSFYRGAWCPICSIELRALRDILPELLAADASLIAISPQGPDDSLPLVQSLDLGFDVLSDLDQSITAAYGLRFELTDELKALYEQIDMPLTEANADGTWNLPVPATYVIDRDGVVRARHVDPDYRTRMEPSDILAAVSALPR